MTPFRDRINVSGIPLLSRKDLESLSDFQVFAFLVLQETPVMSLLSLQLSNEHDHTQFPCNTRIHFSDNRRPSASKKTISIVLQPIQSHSLLTAMPSLLFVRWCFRDTC